MRSSKTLLLAALVCFAAGIGTATLLIANQTDDPGQPPLATTAEATETNATQARHTNQAVQAKALAALPRLPPLPRSLQGSSPDVRLQTDASGDLLIEADILHLFEFYLSALLEEPLETSLTRISLALAEQLQGPALAQARDLLKRYLDYKIALADLDRMPVLADASGNYSLEAIAQRQQRLQALRQAHFSAAENTAFFQEENAYDGYMAQYLAIAQAKDLDASQRQQELAQLERQLPEPMRQARAQATQQSQLYETTEELKQHGASAEELFQTRAQTLGAEAATALAELDKRQADWDRRLASYQQERAAIRQSGLSAQDQQAALASLIEQRFAASERLQVQAMELYR
ncbi:MAG: lipase secretion chaperone [Pseudomonas sp.]